MKFVKMHGAGNDYVYVDGFQESINDPTALAIAVSNRNFGIGTKNMLSSLHNKESHVTS